MGPASVITSVGRFINNLRFRRSDQTSEAIACVSRALHESEKYFLLLEQGRERSEEKEHQISDLWEHAAEPVRRVDREFSSWCRYKARYWLTRDRYTPEEIKQLNIGLDNMNKRMHELMDKN